MAMNLDDIFSDVMFTPDGDTVFLSEEKESMLNSGEGGDFKIYCTKNGQAVAQAKIIIARVGCHIISGASNAIYAVVALYLIGRVGEALFDTRTWS